ncbi:MAG: YajG family lipoprotein [Candidatus Omnitrophica bacterium]|nr:YajG family lipoprotein [Candidatus Omnitrophota bacterium]MDD5653925.1 YajG family lipoprotein [Candidatus Omnitrophota bacterium]
MLKKIGLLLLILSLGGCAYIDQNLCIEPQLQVADANIGQGKKVVLKVIDDRDEQLIGKRGNQFVPGGKISTKQDLAEILEKSMVDGLRKKGFDPVKNDELGNSLKVELRSLEYNTSMGLWTGGNIGTSVVKITATQPSGKNYEKTYRSQKEIRTAFVGSQETNAKVINGALANTLDKVFEDRELLDFLAE